MHVETRRTDGNGRAFAGSQLQIQTYVNRRSECLNGAVARGIPELNAASAMIEWVSPLEADRFREYSDWKFLARLGLENYANELANFWPAGGPVWDALARVVCPSNKALIGVLLVEAKSRPTEFYSGGCGATALQSVRQIDSALSDTQRWCGAEPGSKWTGRLYQYANRLAHVHFFRNVLGINAWLTNVHILDDPHSPTSLSDWETALPSIKRELGLSGGAPYTIDVFLPACGRELFEQSEPIYEGLVMEEPQ